MDAVLDVCVSEPIIDPVLDVCVREPIVAGCVGISDVRTSHADLH